MHHVTKVVRKNNSRLSGKKILRLIMVSHRTQTPVSWVEVLDLGTQPPPPQPASFTTLFSTEIWTLQVYFCVCETSGEAIVLLVCYMRPLLHVILCRSALNLYFSATFNKTQEQKRKHNTVRIDWMHSLSVCWLSQAGV